MTGWSFAEVPVSVSVSAGGAVEVDPELLWHSVVEAGTQAVAQAGVPIALVGLANQGETIVWQDGRSAAVCDRMRADGVAELVRRHSGLELDPYVVAPKIRWLREQGVRAEVVTTPDMWLLHRLCGGGFVTDAATASRTALLDLDRAAWSPALLDVFGLTE